MEWSGVAGNLHSRSALLTPYNWRVATLSSLCFALGLKTEVESLCWLWLAVAQQPLPAAIPLDLKSKQCLIWDEVLPG